MEQQFMKLNFYHFKNTLRAILTKFKITLNIEKNHLAISNF